MAFSRTSRIDRRRRVMLDAVAADAEYAVESVRAKKRALVREKQESLDDHFTGAKYRDPGYSQAVRRTCQQRMVQLIPIRRGTLTVVLTGMWMIWVGLVLAHYWLHVPVIPVAQSLGSQATDSVSSIKTAAKGTPKLPIAELFNLRSSNSIAHWLTCQLWMLTALAAWMNFQLRRHKLDDYRARYRIWAVLACAAIFSSFDASSSFLYLLGMSIDGWTRSEIGYGGWPLVLATFASMIGILGIRLCSELRSVPGSIAFWLSGLLAWATSALLGTGLIKTSWESATVDLIVGACWLGGILLVFQAAGVYLRQTYIAAQKRFLERNGMNLKPIRFKVPQISLPFQRKKQATDESEQTPTKRGWKMPWGRRADDFNNADDDTDQSEGRTSSTSSKASSRSASAAEKEVRSDKPKVRLFGLIPDRSEQNEQLEEQPLRIVDGPEVGTALTKKPGWFGIGGNRNAIDKSTKSAEATAAEPKSRVASPSSAILNSKSESPADQKQSRGWIPKIGRGRTSTELDANSAGQSKKTLETTTTKSSKDANQKSSWLSFASRKEKSDKAKSPAIASAAKKVADTLETKPTKRRLFGLFDSLKLKPPGEDRSKDKQSTAKSVSNGPVPVKQNQALPSTQSSADDEEDNDDEGSNDRPLSKAERKRLRRTQQDDRRAA